MTCTFYFAVLAGGCGSLMGCDATDAVVVFEVLRVFVSHEAKSVS